jgi:hypothetical protein
MSMEILTKEDLQQFKQELFSELRSALSIQKPLKRWLKSSEVKVILDCSAGTLQNLRINGTLSPTKIGGTWYYDAEQVQNLLSKAC